MDNFTELLIERERTSATAVIQLISWIVVALTTGVVGYLLFMIGGLFVVSFALIVLFILAYANFNMLNMLNIEFEYSLVNNYFDIDKIIGAKKRERMLSIKINDIIEIGRYDNTPIDRSKYSHTITPVSTFNSESLWYFIAEDEHGKSHYVLFEPDSRILNHLKRFISRNITNGCLDEF